MSWRCASIAPPGGGPEDKTPPVVVSHTPVRDSVRVGRSSVIVVEFSEPMNRESLERSIFISPPPVESPILSWDGRVLSIRLVDSLPKDRTCVVTIGTSATDVHQNGLSRALSFAFSTGDSIDQGRISGRVVSEATSAVAVLAYRLNGVADPDSEIHRRKADYVTQTDRMGRYELPYLADGTYRVYGLVDLDDDGRYSVGIDGIGLPFKDVILTDMLRTATRVDMQIGVEDKAAFDVTDVVPMNLNTISAVFNRAVLRPMFTEGHARFSDPGTHLFLTDSASGDTLTVRDWFINTQNWTDLRLLVDRLDTGRTYWLDVRDILSEHGDTLKAARVRLQAVQGMDTGRVSSEWILPEGGTAENIMPDDPLEFRFDKGLNRSSFEKHFVVTDTSRDTVAGTFRWWHSGYVTFVPVRMYKSLMDYTVRLQGDSIRDWEDMSLSDSATVIRFRTFKADSLGAVMGRLEDADANAHGPFVVTCRSLTEGGRGYRRDVAGPGPFEFKHVIPGKYVVAVFRDEDMNGTYSHGRTVPVVFGEPFAAFADTVTVRPNWETSNVVIRFTR